ncbi:metal ABC transporter solute-binding protein, Zn/Mn family [Syntrophomonas palmitatica]|uniref:metal ABC transporter solute-binding protein, Zn/Mn family n=1 Tax=Syntrophomonas palmitatica TaxID=402877 RepID=UPI0006D14B31|nr:zinc ABC transporter substrate-binding protein [Syntrophomonas palmitatica]
MFTNPKRLLKSRVLSALLCSVLLLASGCSSAKQKTAEPVGTQPARLCVAVSIVPEASYIKAIGEDLVEVETMVPPGASPENYAPSPQIMERLSLAKIYFAVGVPAETSGILPRLRQVNRQMKVVDLAAKVDQVYPAREISPGEKDPHRWMSPRRAQEMVRIIAQELALADPSNAEIYQKNARIYQAQLADLDQEIRNSLAKVKGRSFIVYHPAMGYFADDYGLKMIALEEEGKEANAHDLQAVIDKAKKENIRVVFYQAEMDSKQAKTLARELNGQAELIAPLAPDYIENLRKTAQVRPKFINFEKE